MEENEEDEGGEKSQTVEPPQGDCVLRQALFLGNRSLLHVIRREGGGLVEQREGPDCIWVLM